MPPNVGGCLQRVSLAVKDCMFQKLTAFDDSAKVSEIVDDICNFEITLHNSRVCVGWSADEAWIRIRSTKEDFRIRHLDHPRLLLSTDPEKKLSANQPT